MINIPPLFVALLSIALGVAAQLSLKVGVNANRAMEGWVAYLHPMVFVGLSLYAISAAVWLFVLARMDVSKAYPLVSLGFVATTALAAVLGESVSMHRWIGVAMISLGALVVARS